ncbi:MAG: mechanosensitive ion channel family protein [Pseudomonadota bacterium]
MRRTFRRIVPIAGLALLLPLIALVWFAPSPSAAQIIDYGKLLLSEPDQTAEPRQSRPVEALPYTQPAQSTPNRTAPVAGASNQITGNAPSAADYADLDTSGAGPVLDETRKVATLFRARVKSIVERLPEAWAEIKTTLAAAAPTGRPSYFVGVALFAGLLLAIGRAAGLIFGLYLGYRMMMAVQKPNPIGYFDKLPVLAIRLFLTVIVSIITITIASAIAVFFDQDHRATELTVLYVFGAYAAIQLVDTTWRMVLAPYLSEYRLLAVEDAPARRLYAWLSSAATLGIATMTFTFWMRAVGLPEEMLTAMTVGLSLGPISILIAMIWVHRSTISRAIRGGRARSDSSRLALVASVLWAPIAVAYILFTWGANSFRLIMGVETDPISLIAPYGIVLGGLILYAVAAFLIEWLFARTRRIAAINLHLDEQRRQEEEEADLRLREAIRKNADGATDMDGDLDEEGGGAIITPADEPTRLVRPRRGMKTLEELALRAASLFALGAVIYSIVRYWGGPDVFERIPGFALAEDLIDTIFVGYLIFHAARIWIDNKITEEGGDEPESGLPMDGEGGGAGATRLATLLPLFRNFVLIVIVVTVVLLIAMELGVNVAPLFAGAGIVGLAIGFGSQALVRDILSGAFFLADDAFRKGEYIDVGDVKGTVEKISLRSFQLRHHLGMLHTIPFGEIQFLTNFSRDWVMMKLPLRLTYDTDVENVRKLVKKLGIRLAEDPEIGDKFIQPVKSQGVIQMDDSAMIIRIKFMTYPGEQWVLRKRIYAEIRELFEREGIKFAHREVTVRLPDLPENRQLTHDEQAAVGAAARRAGDQVDEERQLAAGGAVDLR